MVQVLQDVAVTQLVQKPFDKPLKSERLNVESKSRANLFAWRGQFTPQLVEALLKSYALPQSHVFDPFAGSGTVLLEAGRLGLSATGFEVNPAAALLARTYSFINVSRLERLDHLCLAEQAMKDAIPETLPLFNSNADITEKSPKESLLSAIRHAQTEDTKLLLETFSIVVDFAWKKATLGKIWSTWSRFRMLLLNLPESVAPIRVGLADARALPLKDGLIDFVLTSPPYINVFNYHQNYRASVEALGWTPLGAARSEIGSNRKFRQNRLLTVIQYCIDQTYVLRELQRVCKDDARIIFVVGRESNVRKTPFFNAAIILRLATEVLGFDVVLTQERVFSNRFGQNIFEDLLHLRPPCKRVDIKSAVNVARDIAKQTLVDAQARAPVEVLEDFESAIAQVEAIQKSTIFTSTAAGAKQFLTPFPKAEYEPMPFPMPHLEKLKAVLQNAKLPAKERPAH